MYGAAGAVATVEQMWPQTVTERPWYALLTRAGLERRACIFLRLRGLDAYWPRYRSDPTRLQPRNKVIWRSVIPGYMFIQSPVNFELVERAPGVRIMRNGDGGPVEIPNMGMQGIEQIREIEVALNASAVAAAEGIPFRRGQKVRITKLEIEGRIERLDGRRRIVVSAPMFGSVVPLTVSVADIESV